MFNLVALNQDLLEIVINRDYFYLFQYYTYSRTEGMV